MNNQRIPGIDHSVKDTGSKQDLLAMYPRPIRITSVEGWKKRPLGAETVLRVETPNSIMLCSDRNVIFSKTHMRKQMGFTNECWKDFMYLCRHTEPLIAYSMIRVYKEHAVERYEHS